MDSRRMDRCLGRFKRVSWLVSCLWPGVRGVDSGRVLLKGLSGGLLSIDWVYCGGRGGGSGCVNMLAPVYRKMEKVR